MTDETGVLSRSSRESRHAQSERAAELHFRTAAEAAERGEYDRAAAEYTYCIQLAPKMLEAFARRGEVLRVLGRSDAAIADFTAYLKAAHQPDSRVLLGRGQLYALAGMNRLAADDFAAALGRQPDDPAAHLSLGQSLSRLGEHAEAIDNFTRVTEITPGNAYAHYELGRSRLALGQAKEAVADLTRAVQLNPFLWLALAKRAEAHAQLGEADRAVSDLTEAIRLDPTNADLYATRGEVRCRTGSPSGLPDFDEAVRLAPRAPEWVARRGVACLRCDKFEQADTDLTEALRAAPENVAWLRARGEARLRLTNLDGALADFAEASRLAPESGEAYLGQALVYVARGDHGLALPHLEKALSLSPRLADAHHQRARCLFRMDRIPEAIDAATQALNIDPTAPLPRRLRAEAYLKAARVEEAYADLAQLVHQSPDDPVVYHLRGKLEFRRGRSEAAVADLTKALKLDPKFTEALADRAGIYRRLNRHKEALADLITAVQFDTKYAAEFLVQQGILHGAAGEFNGALADFTVALLIDPANKAAVRGKELVSQLRDTHGSPDLDSEERELERRAEADRALNGGAGRARSWRAQGFAEAFSSAARALPPRAARRPAGQGGIILEPEYDSDPELDRPEDVDLAHLPGDGDNEYDLAGDYAERADTKAGQRSAVGKGQKSAPALPAASRSTPDLPSIKPTKPPARPPEPSKSQPEFEPEFDDGEDEASTSALTVDAPPPKPPVPLLPPPPAAKAPPAPPANLSPTDFNTALAAKLAAAKAAAPKKTSSRIDDEYDDEELGTFGKMKRWANSKRGQQILLPMGFLCVSYFIYDQFFSEPSLASAVSTGQKAPYTVPPGNVMSAEQYWNEFAKDNTAAGKKYADQYVELTGKIRKVNIERAQVVLETPSSTNGITCGFLSKDLVEGLKPGDPLTVQGEAVARAKATDDVSLGMCKPKKK